ncbi:chorismate mutase [Rhodoligotrophos defluvii]|uniref:chorismate mutase n=1 Tax=Rhodoligotrophos defluvii TaxID=2561934 RepID=UPI0010C95AB4|nr:chorismate mutase [Rhodoligotrophos defluvii]
MTAILEQAVVQGGSESEALAAIRREIDRIDEELLGLLAERFAAVEEVRRVKATAVTGSTPMRPSREAEVIRRLLTLRKDPLPADIVVAIWRELMGSATQQQQKTTIHIPASPGSCAFHDVVRGHFGSRAPIVSHPDAKAAVRAVSGAPADIAVVPARAEGWAAALSSTRGDLGVIARIPVIGGSGSIDGFLIGHAPSTPTGLDETLVLVTMEADAPLDPERRVVREFWRERSTESQGGWLWLAVLEGWREERDVIAALEGGTKRALAVKVLGRYATPVR